MKNYTYIKTTLLFLFVLAQGFSQITTSTATPASIQNCNSCSGLAWNGSLFSTNTPGIISKELYLTNLGFNIPINAIIIGVTLSIGTYTCCPEQFFDSKVQMIINGVPSGINKATLIDFLPYPSYNNKVYGGNNDLWGNTLSPLIINNSNFGVSFEITKNNITNNPCCFALMGPSIPLTYVPLVTIYYSISTGIIESQTSTSQNINAYSFEDKMYVNNSSSEIITNAKVKIYNMLGELINEEIKTIAPKEIENISLTNPENGFYFITISSAQNELIFSKKVFITK